MKEYFKLGPICISEMYEDITCTKQLKDNGNYPEVSCVARVETFDLSAQKEFYNDVLQFCITHRLYHETVFEAIHLFGHQTVETRILISRCDYDAIAKHLCTKGWQWDA